MTKRRKRAKKRLSSAREAKQRQVRQTRQRARAVKNSVSATDVLPFSPKATAKWLLALFPKAFGFGTAKDQITASIALIIAAFLSTPFSAGASAILAVPFAITLVVGLIRLVPAADNGFVTGRKKAKNATEGRRWGRG